MNRREFLKLFVVATSGPGAIAMLPSPAAIPASPPLYEITRERLEATKRELIRQVEDAVFRSTQVVAVSSDGNYIRLRSKHSWNPEWGAG